VKNKKHKSLEQIVQGFLFYLIFFVQVDGVSAKSRGYISKRPKSIVKESRILENGEYAA